MKTILLPTDFSKNAWNALFTVLKLMDRQHCHFILLNTYEPQLANVLGDRGELRLGAIYQALKEDSQKQMDDLLTYLKDHHSNPRHSFERMHQAGDLLAAIREILKEKPVDLIVMGTRGATGAKRVFLGSNTVRVFKHLRNKPILAVPEQFDLQRLEQVVFPSDFTRQYQKYELELLKEIIGLWKAELHIVYIAEEFELTPIQESNKKLLGKQLMDYNVRFVEEDLRDSVPETILRYSDAKNAELIVLMHYRHSLLESLTHRPVAKRMAFETEIPLLILPELG